MDRRVFCAALAAMPLAAPALAQTNKLSLKELSKYLNGLLSAKGAFTQINPDGSLSKGTFFLKRPGRMRFEYEPPNASLVIAGSGTLAVFDKKSNQGPQQYPLSKTPLSIILEKRVNLNASGMIMAHDHDGTATTITARDPKYPNHGNVKLVFTDGPTELRQWVVTDESGRQTTVVLGQLDKKVRIPAKLFDIVAITKKGGASR